MHLYNSYPLFSSILASKMALFLCLFFFFLVSSVTASDRCVRQSKAAYFSKDLALSSGACEYGSLAFGFFNGHLAAGVPSLYKDGAGCGACYEVRCKNKKLCTTSGTKLILTDLTHSHKSDFILSKKAFSAMAQKGKDKQILKHGIVDVEYKRIPCEYKNQNLSVQIVETSQKPQYLAIKFLYQGGQTEIVRVQVFKVDWTESSSMSRNHGAVWDTDTVPEGALLFQIGVVSGCDRIWLLTKQAIPANWKPGTIYDTGIQFSAINAKGQERCAPCDEGNWR